MPSKSQGWQGEDVRTVHFSQWKPFAAHCEKLEPLWRDWRKHELRYALQANSSGVVLGLQTPSASSNPPWSPGSHMRLLKHELAAHWQTCLCVHPSVRVSEKEAGQRRGMQNVCIWHHLLYFPTPSYPCQSSNLKLPFTLEVYLRALRSHASHFLSYFLKTSKACTALLSACPENRTSWKGVFLELHQWWGAVPKHISIQPIKCYHLVECIFWLPCWPNVSILASAFTFRRGTFCVTVHRSPTYCDHM